MITNNVTPGLSSDPGAGVYSKTATPVHVRFASCAGTLRTLEGNVEYAAGDAILTGPAQENWTMSRERLDATYSAISPAVAGQSGEYQRRANFVLARQQNARFEVVTPNGSRLTGNAGDWLVEYSPGDQSVVADSIFKATYAPSDQVPPSGRHARWASRTPGG